MNLYYTIQVVEFQVHKFLQMQIPTIPHMNYKDIARGICALVDKK